MNLAYARHARDIWVVNVGDLKPLVSVQFIFVVCDANPQQELPINHFMDIAYNITLWGPNPVEWLEAWAKRDFYETLAPEIARVAATYSNLVGERKYELVSAETWSISHYQEAERVLYSWKVIANEAYEIYNRLAAKHKPAFFEMVLHPIYAGENIHKLYISAAKNNLYAKQGRNSANFMAEETLSAFKRDHDITRNYHELLNGKWNHMMDQTHIGYTYWQQPMRQVAPSLQYVQALEGSLSGDIRVTVEGQKQDKLGDDDGISLISPSLPESSPNGPSRWFDISNTGLTNVTFQVQSEPFVKLSQDRGALAAAGEGSDVRIFLALDWSNAPNGNNSTSVSITGVSEGTGVKTSARVLVPYVHVSTPAGFAGYVEADGYIAFDSWNISNRLISNKTQNKGPSLLDIWQYGVTLSPLNIRSLGVNEAPSLKVPVWIYTTTRNSTISLIFAPSLNTDRDHPMRYALSLDTSDPQIVQVVHDRPAGELPRGWDTAVSEERWISKTEWRIPPGQHVLDIKLLDGGLVLKKVVIDLGGVRPSGLGPPESVWINA
jgi:Gylcosyl hydrolase family 115 C-terminal domain/Glycosyl hydrolase family 115